MKKYKVSWFKTYTMTGEVEIEAENLPSAEYKVDNMLGDLEGSNQLTDMGINAVILVEEDD